jgi:hypothetical protein
VEAGARHIDAVDVLAGDRDALHLAELDVAEEFRIRDVRAAGALSGILEDGDERQDQQEDDDPQGEISEIRIH